MKTLISLMVAVVFTATSVPAFAFDWNVPWEKDDRTKIEKDKEGGYTQEQSDYKSRRNRTNQEKTDAAYYNGEYHSKGKNFKQGEWQFVDSANGGSWKKTTKTKKSSNKKIAE